MAGNSAIQKYLKAAQDADWAESKHHRADNGRFTSDSGRAHGKSAEEERKGKAKGGSDGGRRKEMSEEQASRFVRAAFKSADRKLNGLKLSGHALEADTDKADEEACSAINGFLKKHGLRAKVDGETKFRIAEDGYDDIRVLDDPVLEVLVDVWRIKMLANDLHYRAGGKEFYALHRFASEAMYLVDHADELNEVYYMGEKGGIPPDTAFVVAKAAELVGRAGGEDECIKAAVAACSDAANAAGVAKKGGVSSGTAAVLDEIAKNALRLKGLLGRMTAQKDAIDAVVAKGVYFKPDGAAQDALTIKKDAVGRSVIA